MPIQKSIVYLINKEKIYLKCIDGKYGGISAYIHSGETPINAAIRQLKNEFALDITRDKLYWVSETEVNGVQLFIFKCYEYYGKPTPCWYTRSQLKALNSKNLKPFLQYLVRFKIINRNKFQKAINKITQIECNTDIF